MYAYCTQDYIDGAGNRFRVEYRADTDAAPPWHCTDIHGPVSDWTRRLKRPGEVLLCQRGNGHFRYYDLQAATRQARYGNWNNWQRFACPDERGKALRAAVMDDYACLRDWCNDVWHYMGIVVFPLDDEGNELRSRSHSIWGIESNSVPSYIQEQISWLLRDAGATGQIQGWEVCA